MGVAEMLNHQPPKCSNFVYNFHEYHQNKFLNNEFLAWDACNDAWNGDWTSTHIFFFYYQEKHRELEENIVELLAKISRVRGGVFKHLRGSFFRK